MISAFCTGCQGESLTPYPELLIEVDTNAPVPLAISRLRIDLFDHDGAWFETRDVNLDSPAAWPTSFGMYSSGATDRTAVVRLRAYGEEALRDYCTEGSCKNSIVEDLPYEPRPTPVSLIELCDNAPLLAWGHSVTQRRGAYSITGASIHSALGGSVAAQVSVPTAGDYHFEASSLRANTSSNLPSGPSLNLAVRRRCDDASSELGFVATVEDPNPKTGISRVALDLDLTPGDYTLVAGGNRAFEPADVTLLATSSSLPGSDMGAEPTQTVAELVMTEKDRTPTTEPVVSATIDRLVLVETVPNAKRSISVLLDGDCFGVVANLAVEGKRLQANRATTCLDAEHRVAPLVVENSTDFDRSTPSASRVGSWGQRMPCASAPRPNTICVGGGAHVLGGTDFGGFGVSSSLPEHVVKLSPFFLDRDEVTIERFRAAIAAGFVSPDAENPLLSCIEDKDPDSVAVYCVSWYLARAFCQFVGGDLPTEAQWEFAASFAGRDVKTLFPWGDDRPECKDAVFGRGSDTLSGGTSCELGGGRLPVDARAEPGMDVTPQGIVGLGGGVTEWVLDAAHSFAGPCWTNVELTDPLCWEDDAVLRSQRGHSFSDSRDALRATARRRRPAWERDASVGFRCAYKDEAQ